MSNPTTNRGLKKGVDADDLEVYLTVDLASSLDNLDTHTHAATDLTGIVPTARLGTGTANSTTFLRGDQTWAVPAGGGGGGAAVDITNTPAGNIGSTNVQNALNELDTEKATVTHAHAASDITSGLIDTGRLGSGTANVNTYLRGNQTYAALSANDLGFGTVPTARLGSGAASSSTPLWGDQSYRAITGPDIASGLVGTARLGSGAVSATTALFGDQSWRAITASDVASGTIATARLGTGTADATKYLAGDQTYKLIPLLKSDGTVGVRKSVGLTPPVSPSVDDVWEDTFRFVFDPESGAWPNITEVPVTFATNVYTRSIQAGTGNLALGTAGTGGGTKVARIAWTSGTEPLDRRVYTFDDVGLLDDVEIFATLHNRASPQQGFALRINNIGNTSTQNMYSVWNDAIAAYPGVFNLGAWKGIDGSFTPNVNANSHMEGLEGITGCRSLVRASNVVTAVVRGPHAFAAGDQIYCKTLVGTSFDLPSLATISTVSGQTITWPQTGADETATVFVYAGYIEPMFPDLNVPAIYPHAMRIRLVGNKLRAKFWRQSQGEPSWSDPRHVLTWTDTTPTGPTGTGKVGIINAHHNSAGKLSDWGPIEITRPGGAGNKIWTGTTWKKLAGGAL